MATAGAGRTVAKAAAGLDQLVMVWLRNDLRLHDHGVFDQARQMMRAKGAGAAAVLPV